MRDPAPTPPTLIGVVRQWPVATTIAQNLPVGSLISLARTSSSLRAALHGFDDPTVCEFDVSNDRRSRGQPNDFRKDLRPRKELQVGHHRTPYWEGLKRVAQFTCSSRTHTKGDKTRSCLYCSMPICESCVIKHGFGKNENTFKNRCRFMCQHCWDTGNQQRQRRYTGEQDTAEIRGHKLAREAGRFCVCTSRGGWVCNDCKENQNNSMRVDGSNICFGQDCGMKLEDDKDRRKICLWCDKPLPRGRASMQSRLAFDQKLIMMDASERVVSVPEKCYDVESPQTWRDRILLSRRDIRGNYAVKDDPDADVRQYLRYLDIVDYKSLCQELPMANEIWGSKLGEWKYNTGFLRCFMKKCTKHKDAASLKKATSVDPPGPFQLNTNMDVWMMKARRTLHEPFKAGTFGESMASELGAAFDWDMMEDYDWAEEQTLAEALMLADEQTLAEERTLAEQTLADERTLAGEQALAEEQTLPKEEKLSKEVDHPSSKESKAESGKQEQDDSFIVLQDDEVSEARKGTQGQARPDQQSSETGPPDVQHGERPPEYGAVTRILERGDGTESE